MSSSSNHSHQANRKKCATKDADALRNFILSSESNCPPEDREFFAQQFANGLINVDLGSFASVGNAPAVRSTHPHTNQTQTSSHQSFSSNQKQAFEGNTNVANVTPKDVGIEILKEDKPVSVPQLRRKVVKVKMVNKDTGSVFEEDTSITDDECFNDDSVFEWYQEQCKQQK